MPLFNVATLLGLVALLSVGMMIRRLVHERPFLPWDYSFAVSMLFCLVLAQNSHDLEPSKQFLDVAPAIKPEGGSFLTIGRHGIGTSKLNDPTVKKLFETSGGLGADEDCKKHRETIARLNSEQRDELVKILTQVFDPGNAGPPPLTTSTGCALGIASDITPLDQRLVGPLLALMTDGNFFAADAARLLKLAKVLPADRVRDTLENLSINGAGNLVAVLKQVPVDSYDGFAEGLSSASGVKEIAYLIVLARSPRAYPQVTERIREITANRGNSDRELAALIAAPNALPTEEAIVLLSDLARAPNGALTLNSAVTAANDKVALSPLVPMVVDSWEPFDLMGNEIKVDTLVQLKSGIVESLPKLVKKMVLVPAGTADWVAKRHAAAERCYRSLGGSDGRPESSCWPDITPPLSNSCEGRMTELSPRLRRIIESLDTTDPRLPGKVSELLAADEAAVREFAVHVLARMEGDAARKLLVATEGDRSHWVAATAFRTQLRRTPEDAALASRVRGFVKGAVSAGCLGSSSVVNLLAGLGDDGVEALVTESHSGPFAQLALAALGDADRIPARFEQQLFSLLEGATGQACSSEQLIGSLLKALLKLDEPSEKVLHFIRRALNGDELRCCSETTRVRAALGALAAVAAEKKQAFELLRSHFSLADRLPGGQAEINRALLRASPGEGRRVMYEMATVADLERRMAALVNQVRTSSKICLKADGTVFDPVQAKPIGPRSSGEEIAAHFSSVAAELDGKGIDSSKGELERVIASEVSMLAQTLNRDGARILALRNASCESVLHAAVLRGNSEQLRTILSFKPELDLRDRSGRTALMHAAERNDLTAVTMLLDAGAGIDLQDFGSQFSETALTIASNARARDVVKLLLARGASESVGRPRVPFELSLLASEDSELIAIANQRKQGCAKGGR